MVIPKSQFATFPGKKSNQDSGRGQNQRQQQQQIDIETEQPYGPGGQDREFLKRTWLGGVLIFVLLGLVAWWQTKEKNYGRKIDELSARLQKENPDFFAIKPEDDELLSVINVARALEEADKSSPKSNHSPFENSKFIFQLDGKLFQAIDESKRNILGSKIHKLFFIKKKGKDFDWDEMLQFVFLDGLSLDKARDEYTLVQSVRNPTNPNQIVMMLVYDHLENANEKAKSKTSQIFAEAFKISQQGMTEDINARSPPITVKVEFIDTNKNKQMAFYITMVKKSHPFNDVEKREAIKQKWIKAFTPLMGEFQRVFEEQAKNSIVVSSSETEQ